MTRIDSYKHLDKESSLNVSLSMEEVARECVKLNYGAHRLLSALVHELRAKEARMLADYLARHPEETNTTPWQSELADGIEALLNKGLTS